MKSREQTSKNKISSQSKVPLPPLGMMKAQSQKNPKTTPKRDDGKEMTFNPLDQAMQSREKIERVVKLKLIEIDKKKKQRKAEKTKEPEKKKKRLTSSYAGS